MGYVFERQDNKCGCRIYIEQDIEYLKRGDSADNGNDVKATKIDISQENSKNFIIGVVYRPPDTSKYLR